MAFAKFEWLLAGRYLKPSRREGLVSVIAIFSFLGIMLGVATLIIVMAVMNGFRAELLDRILGLNGHIIVQSETGPFDDYDGVAEKVRQVPGVVSVVPFVEGQVMISAGDVASGALVRGMRKEDLLALRTVSGHLKSGSLDQFTDGNGVLIGQRLANQMTVYEGANVTLMSAKGPVTPFGVAPQVKAYPVLGTFEIGMSEYDAAFVFMPLKEAQLYFQKGEGVSGLEVMVQHPDEIERYRGPIATAIGKPAQIVDWKQMNDSFFSALQVERNVMFLILTLIILVAALNIVSGLIMLVKDKSQAIAILRTMGASQGAIMRIFFITGAAIGCAGTFAGFLIGVLFCKNIENLRKFLSDVTGTTLFDPTIYFLQQMPAKIEPSEVASVVLMALALSFLATLYPSWRAARLDPVDALRYE